MKPIYVRHRLNLAVFFLSLSIPFVALQVVLLAQAPWWDLPYQTIQVWTSAMALVVFPLSLWLLAGHKWALYLTGVLGLIWTAAAAALAFRFKSFWLGIFSLALGLYWISIWSWIRYEMQRSFFDPLVRWYQGLPRPVPHLSCKLKLNLKKDQTEEWSMQVARIDRDGAFLFSKGFFSSTLHRHQLMKKKLQVKFSFKDREVECEAIPVKESQQSQGLGVRFYFSSADQFKDLGDFVELLRGHGYV